MLGKQGDCPPTDRCADRPGSQTPVWEPAWRNSVSLSPRTRNRVSGSAFPNRSLGTRNLPGDRPLFFVYEPGGQKMRAGVAIFSVLFLTHFCTADENKDKPLTPEA